MNTMEPVFLCGALRSGTTVLGLMLKFHPQIVSRGEFDFLFDCVGDSGKLPEISDYLDFLNKNRIFKAHNLEVNPSDTFQNNINSFIRQLEEPNHILSMNVHRNFQRIQYLFPNARYIHLKRDARDVARSSIGMGWSGNVYFGVDHWIDTELSWDLLKSDLRDDQYIEIMFEELISDPKKVLTQLCDFLGMQYSDKMLDYPDESTYSKPDTSLVKQWERKQTKKQVQLVEYKAGNLIESRGYQLSDYPKYKPGIVDLIQLTLQNKIFRLRFGIRHFGLSLYLSEKISRLPALNHWHTNCVMKMNELNKKLLK